MKVAKPILLSLLLSAFLAGCGDSSTGSDGGDSSDDLSSGTSFVPGSSDEGGSFEELSSADGANDDNGKSQQGGSSQGKPVSSSDDSTSSMDESSSSSAAAENFCEPGSYDPDAQLCDVRDGKLYGIIRIGAQTWMAENLNFDYKVAGATYRNWCYNDSAKYCSTMGRLYTWGAAMDSAAVGCGHGRECAADTGRVKGVCPNDWHLPSPAEWDTLFAAVGGQSVAGTALKSKTGWHDGSASYIPGTNSSGFSALPSGYRSATDGYFRLLGGDAHFWSSSEEGTVNAYGMYLYYSDSSANQYNYHKKYGFAVRCVKD